MEKLIKGSLASTYEIATKVNEIVKWINKQDASNSDKYPDFEKWYDEAIATPVITETEFGYAELQLAPEDFYIMQDGERKENFTWDEAMEYEKTVLKPNGWRLPTCAEWAQICACYIGDDGEYDFERVKRELKLGNSDGDDDFWSSYFWSSSSYSAQGARCLNFANDFLDPQFSDLKDYGYSVRCVARKRKED